MKMNPFKRLSILKKSAHCSVKIRKSIRLKMIYNVLHFVLHFAKNKKSQALYFKHLRLK